MLVNTAQINDPSDHVSESNGFKAALSSILVISSGHAERKSEMTHVLDLRPSSSESACECACRRVRVRACARVCVSVCVCRSVEVFMSQNVKN